MTEKNAPWLDWPTNREVEGWRESILFSTVGERDLELLVKSLCLMAEQYESEGGSWAPAACVMVLPALVNISCIGSNHLQRQLALKRLILHGHG